MEEIELNLDDGTSYKLIVDSGEAEKLRSDPSCAAKYISVLRQLSPPPIQPAKKIKLTPRESAPVIPTDTQLKDSSFIDSNNDTYRWSGKAVKLLIVLRIEMDEEFESKLCRKMLLWEEIARKMKNIGGHNMTGFSCDKKWRNLLITYRRLKDLRKRNKVTSWEYFDVMDEWASTKEAFSQHQDSQPDTQDLAVDDSNSSSSSEPISDGEPATYNGGNCVKKASDASKAPTAKLCKVTRRLPCKRCHGDEPPKWFEDFMKLRKVDQDKRFELEERRLALEAAQVKAMEDLVAAISASTHRSDTAS